MPGGVSILSLMTDLVRSHCGPDRSAKVIHQLALTRRAGMDAFDHGRATDFRDISDARIQRAAVLSESLKGKGATLEQAAEVSRRLRRQGSPCFRQRR